MEVDVTLCRDVGFQRERESDPTLLGLPDGFQRERESDPTLLGLPDGFQRQRESDPTLLGLPDGFQRERELDPTLPGIPDGFQRERESDPTLLGVPHGFQQERESDPTLLGVPHGFQRERESDPTLLGVPHSFQRERESDPTLLGLPDGFQRERESDPTLLGLPDGFQRERESDPTLLGVPDVLEEGVTLLDEDQQTNGRCESCESDYANLCMTDVDTSFDYGGDEMGVNNHTHGYMGSLTETHEMGVNNHTHGYMGSLTETHEMGVNNHTHGYMGSLTETHEMGVNNHTHGYMGSLTETHEMGVNNHTHGYMGSLTETHEMGVNNHTHGYMDSLTETHLVAFTNNESIVENVVENEETTFGFMENTSEMNGILNDCNDVMSTYNDMESTDLCSMSNSSPNTIQAAASIDKDKSSQKLLIDGTTHESGIRRRKRKQTKPRFVSAKDSDSDSDAKPLSSTSYSVVDMKRSFNMNSHSDRISDRNTCMDYTDRTSDTDDEMNGTLNIVHSSDEICDIKIDDNSVDIDTEDDDDRVIKMGDSNEIIGEIIQKPLYPKLSVTKRQRGRRQCTRRPCDTGSLSREDIIGIINTSLSDNSCVPSTPNIYTQHDLIQEGETEHTDMKQDDDTMENTCCTKADAVEHGESLEDGLVTPGHVSCMDDVLLECKVCQGQFTSPRALTDHYVSHSLLDKEQSKVGYSLLDKEQCGITGMENTLLDTVDVHQSGSPIETTDDSDLQLNDLNNSESESITSSCVDSELSGGKDKLSTDVLESSTYFCHLCQQRFSNITALQSHVEDHALDGESTTDTKSDNYCGLCEKKFASAGSLYVHNKIHSGENPYTCNTCSKSFRDKTRLTTHIRVHTGEKPYICSVCQKSFSQKGNLKLHQKIHTGERNCVCGVCGNGFRSRSDLVRHMKVHGVTMSSGSENEDTTHKQNTLSLSPSLMYHTEPLDTQSKLHRSNKIKDLLEANDNITPISTLQGIKSVTELHNLGFLDTLDTHRSHDMGSRHRSNDRGSTQKSSNVDKAHRSHDIGSTQSSHHVGSTRKSHDADGTCKSHDADGTRKPHDVDGSHKSHDVDGSHKSHDVDGTRDTRYTHDPYLIERSSKFSDLQTTAYLMNLNMEVEFIKAMTNAKIQMDTVPVQSYTCPMCGTALGSFDAFNHHILIQHNPLTMYGPLSKPATHHPSIMSLLDPFMALPKTDRFTCKQCNEVFSTYEDLAVHTQTHKHKSGIHTTHQSALQSTGTRHSPQFHTRKHEHRSDTQKAHKYSLDINEKGNQNKFHFDTKVSQCSPNFDMKIKSAIVNLSKHSPHFDPQGPPISPHFDPPKHSPLFDAHSPHLDSKLPLHTSTSYYNPKQHNLYFDTKAHKPHHDTKAHLHSPHYELKGPVDNPQLHHKGPQDDYERLGLSQDRGSSDYERACTSQDRGSFDYERPGTSRDHGRGRRSLFATAMLEEMKVASNDKLYSCEFCVKTFRRSHHLQTHLRTHTGDRPYTCVECHKCFARGDHLHNHQRTHTGEKPYQCDVCEKTYSQSHHLLRHKRTHTGERPYQCSLCEKTFSRDHHLKKHLETHRMMDMLPGQQNCKPASRVGHVAGPSDVPFNMVTRSSQLTSLTENSASKLMESMIKRHLEEEELRKQFRPMKTLLSGQPSDTEYTMKKETIQMTDILNDDVKKKEFRENVERTMNKPIKTHDDMYSRSSSSSESNTKNETIKITDILNEEIDKRMTSQISADLILDHVMRLTRKPKTAFQFLSEAKPSETPSFHDKPHVDVGETYSSEELAPCSTSPCTPHKQTDREHCVIDEAHRDRVLFKLLDTKPELRTLEDVVTKSLMKEYNL